jgi:hypothetical protein
MSTLVPESQQTSQALLRTAALQEIMAHQLRRSRPTLNVNTQTDTQESLKFLGQLLRVLEGGGAVRGNQIQGLERLFVEVGRLAFNHFNGHDAERPDVDFAAVWLLLHYFGRHPVGGTYHCGSLGSLFCEFGAESKIGCGMVRF